MDPWQSWALAIVATAGLGYYYTRDSTPKNRTRAASVSTEPLQQAATTAKRRVEKAVPKVKAAAKENNVAAKVLETANNVVAASSEATTTAVNTVQQGATKKNKKAGQAQKGSTAKSSAPQASKSIVSESAPEPEDDEAEDDEDTKEWARQLQARKQGISLSSAGQSGQAVRTKKANAKDQYPSAGDVSDMLEPTPSGPAIIRLTGEEKAKKQHAPKAEVQQESKKARQNRRKVEEARIAREEDERVRQQLLEKQRKTAREARGEPAKNGMTSASAPASSAWSRESKPEAVTNGSAQPLLDTFDQDATSSASSYDAVTNVTTPATVASANADIPSEEAQLEMLNGENGWNEVSTSKKTKKKTQPTESSPVEQPAAKDIKSSYSSASTSDLVKTSAPSKPAMAAKQVSSTNGYAALQAKERVHPDDDEWYVI
jgi:hypothetical protein